MSVFFLSLLSRLLACNPGRLSMKAGPGTYIVLDCSNITPSLRLPPSPLTPRNQIPFSNAILSQKICSFLKHFSRLQPTKHFLVIDVTKYRRRAMFDKACYLKRWLMSITPSVGGTWNSVLGYPRKPSAISQKTLDKLTCPVVWLSTTFTSITEVILKIYCGITLTRVITQTYALK